VKQIALSIMLATLLSAQRPDAAKQPEFEVASIRPAVRDNNHDSDSYQGHFTTHNYTLKRLIASAWDIDIRQVLGGPNWVDSDSYDINAKIPEEFARRKGNELQQMLQHLLEDRFQLAIHREPREVSGYALVLAKQGSKMAVAKPRDDGSDVHSSNAHVTARYVTMEQFARYLSRNREIGKVVVDKTGLTDRFDIDLDWTPERLAGPTATEVSSDDHPSIFTALQEKLGLKLQPAKVPIQAIVIDRAVKPDGN
jgi:uncharacterized protein (TIGR03435 family)